jgi:hypothetical protein
MIFETYSLGVSMAFPYQHTTQRGALLQHTDLPKSLLKHPGRILRTLEALCNLQTANLKKSRKQTIFPVFYLQFSKQLPPKKKQECLQKKFRNRCSPPRPSSRPLCCPRDRTKEPAKIHLEMKNVFTVRIITNVFEAADWRSIKVHFLELLFPFISVG